MIHTSVGNNCDKRKHLTRDWSLALLFQGRFPSRQTSFPKSARNNICLMALSNHVL